ncbi:MAG: alpha/beta fold hydrolase [Bacteroidota bacterium]
MQQSLTVKANRETNLGVDYFCPASDFKDIVVVVPAIGVKKKFYEKFARYLAGENIGVYTFDYSGIGSSKPQSLRGFKATVSDWGEVDLEAMLQFARQQHPEKHLHLITHSGGGMLMGLAPTAQKAKSILTVATPRGTVHDWSKTHCQRACDRR